MRMNQSMRELMAAGFRTRNPTWTEAEVRRAVAVCTHRLNVGRLSRREVMQLLTPDLRSLPQTRQRLQWLAVLMD